MATGWLGGSSARAATGASGPRVTARTKMGAKGRMPSLVRTARQDVSPKATDSRQTLASVCKIVLTVIQSFTGARQGGCAGCSRWGRQGIRNRAQYLLIGPGHEQTSDCVGPDFARGSPRGVWRWLGRVVPDLDSREHTARSSERRAGHRAVQRRDEVCTTVVARDGRLPRGSLPYGGARGQFFAGHDRRGSAVGLHGGLHVVSSSRRGSRRHPELHGPARELHGHRQRFSRPASTTKRPPRERSPPGSPTAARSPAPA